MSNPTFMLFGSETFTSIVDEKGQPFSLNPAFKCRGYADTTNPRIPAKDDNYVFQKDTLIDILVWLMCPSGTGLWLTGPTGAGKTSVIDQIASRLNWPVVSHTMTGRFEFSDLRGQFELSQDETDIQPVMRFRHNALAQAMQNGWILVLNEVDLADPAELSGLNEILEGRPLMISENRSEVIKPHPMFRLCVTGNSNGAGDDSGLYQGIQQQNVAAMDRYRIVKVDYPSTDTEMAILKKISQMPDALLSKCCDFAAALRSSFKSSALSVPFSTRTLVHWVQTAACYRYACAQPLQRALELHFLNRLLAEERYAVEGIAATIFGDVWTADSNGKSKGKTKA